MLPAGAGRHEVGVGVCSDVTFLRLNRSNVTFLRPPGQRNRAGFPKTARGRARSRILTAVRRGSWATQAAWEHVRTFARHDVVKVRTLVAAGVPESTVYDRCRPGGPWQLLLPATVMLNNGAPSRDQLVLAGLLYAGPNSVVTGIEAVRRHGARRGPEPGELVHLLVPHTRQPASARYVVVERTWRMPEAVRRGGIPLAPVARAAIDGARRLASPREATELLADVVQRGLCAVADLRPSWRPRSDEEPRFRGPCCVTLAPGCARSPSGTRGLCGVDRDYPSRRGMRRSIPRTANCSASQTLGGTRWPWLGKSIRSPGTLTQAITHASRRRPHRSPPQGSRPTHPRTAACRGFHGSTPRATCGALPRRRTPPAAGAGRTRLGACDTPTNGLRRRGARLHQSQNNAWMRRSPVSSGWNAVASTRPCRTATARPAAAPVSEPPP